MNMKTKTLIKLIFIFAEGLFLVICGQIKNPLLISMGVAMLVCGIVLAAKRYRIFRNPEKSKEFENAVKDERMIFLSRQSYACAFWVSLICEFETVCVLLLLNMNKYAVALDYVICFQTLVYVISYLICSKKY